MSKYPKSYTRKAIITFGIFILLLKGPKRNSAFQELFQESILREKYLAQFQDEIGRLKEDASKKVFSSWHNSKQTNLKRFKTRCRGASWRGPGKPLKIASEHFSLKGKCSPTSIKTKEGLVHKSSLQCNSVQNHPLHYPHYFHFQYYFHWSNRFRSGWGPHLLLRGLCV